MKKIEIHPLNRIAEREVGRAVALVRSQLDRGCTPEVIKSGSLLAGYRVEFGEEEESCKDPNCESCAAEKKIEVETTLAGGSPAYDAFKAHAKHAKHAESIEVLKGLQAACSDPSFMRSAIGSALSILEADAAALKISVETSPAGSGLSEFGFSKCERCEKVYSARSGECSNCATEATPKELTFPEAMQALLDGKKVRMIEWRNTPAFLVNHKGLGPVREDGICFDVGKREHWNNKWEVAEDAPAAVPESDEDCYRIFKDGNQWCAVQPGFINLQESNAEFGDTPVAALTELARKHPDRNHFPLPEAEKEANALPVPPPTHLYPISARPGYADALEAIETERQHQAKKWPGHEHSVAEWLLIIEKLVTDARRAWVTGKGDAQALDEIRQITATGLAAMEQCGAPRRTDPSKLTVGASESENLVAAVPDAVKMTINEAMIALRDGKKVRCDLWDPGTFIHIADHGTETPSLRNEKGHRFSSEFTLDTVTDWNTREWSIVE